MSYREIILISRQNVWILLIQSGPSSHGSPQDNPALMTVDIPTISTDRLEEINSHLHSESEKGAEGQSASWPLSYTSLPLTWYIQIRFHGLVLVQKEEV